MASSISDGSTPERSTAARTANAASVGPGVMLNSPRCALVSGVRAVETKTASRMIGSSGVRTGVARAVQEPEARQGDLAFVLDRELDRRVADERIVGVDDVGDQAGAFAERHDRD